MNSKGTILLIHGSGNNFRVWDWHIDFFRHNGLVVVAPNLRFHGPVDLIVGLESISLLDYIDDLVEVITSMKVKPIIIG